MQLAGVSMLLTRSARRPMEEDEKDTAQGRLLLRFYVLMLAFSAAPFAYEPLREPSLLRLWAFGGLWVASTGWYYANRAMRLFGKHTCERVFCMKQIARVRQVEGILNLVEIGE